ncbi:hypothetical protein K492DRAFT_129393 [Lichtheimia hyalospora FSU 10163]|nr:hypothetical protein K492DRAFT_129393 [Lichtheimia hyalospora FSU 10163]
MVTRLRERSLVDQVFFSLRSKSNQPLRDCDNNLKAEEATSLRSFTDGSTQDKLIKIELTESTLIKEDVDLVVIDYVGLSTDVQDVYVFSNICYSDHKNLGKVIVDHLPYENDVKIFEREELLDMVILEMLNCRKGSYHRSR